MPKGGDVAHITTNSKKVQCLGLHDLSRRMGSPKKPYGFFMIEVHAPIRGKRELSEALGGRYRNRSRRYVRDNPRIPAVIEPGMYNVGWRRRRVGDLFVEEHVFDRVS